MTIYNDQDRPVYTDDETQVQRTEAAEQPYGFRPPAASDEYPAEALQRKRFGGANWGAGFFGWLVVVAMIALLGAVAAAAVLGLGTTGDTVPTELESASNGGIAAAAGLAIVLLSYFSGGYVAGRMSRFDGGRQGLAVWLVGLLLTGAAMGLGLLFGPQVAFPDQTELPVPELAGSSATGITVLAAVAVGLVGGLVAAVLGGKVGCRYHRKVDDAAYV